MLFLQILTWESKWILTDLQIAPLSSQCTFVTWQEALGSWFCRQSLWKSSILRQFSTWQICFECVDFSSAERPARALHSPLWFVWKVLEFGWFFCGFATKICKIDEFTFHRIPTDLTNGGSNGWSKIMPISTYKKLTIAFLQGKIDFVLLNEYN